MSVMPNPVVSITDNHWSVYSIFTGVNAGSKLELDADPSMFYTDKLIIDGLTVYWATGGVDTVIITVSIHPGPGTSISHILDYYTTTNPVTAKSYYPLGLMISTTQTTDICHLTIDTAATNSVSISAWGRLAGSPLKEPVQPVVVKQIDVWPFKRRE